MREAARVEEAPALLCVLEALWVLDPIPALARALDSRFIRTERFWLGRPLTEVGRGVVDLDREVGFLEPEESDLGLKFDAITPPHFSLRGFN